MSITIRPASRDDVLALLALFRESRTSWSRPSVGASCATTIGYCSFVVRRLGIATVSSACLPAGHLDGGEDVVAGLVRELREELGIEADPLSCRLVLLMHSAPEHATDREYFHLFFTVGRWHDRPIIAEPHKCSDLCWVPASSLPSDLADYVAEALTNIARGNSLALRGW